MVTATLTVWGNLKYCAINRDNEPLLIVSCAYKQGVYSLQFLSPPVSLSSLFLAVFLSRLISVTPSSNYGPHMKCLCVREIPVVLLFECISLKLSIWVILVFSRVYSKQARLENVFIRELLLFFRTPKNLFFRIYTLILLNYEDRKKTRLWLQWRVRKQNRKESSFGAVIQWRFVDASKWDFLGQSETD